jgi:hypothetical protein
MEIVKTGYFDWKPDTYTLSPTVSLAIQTTVTTVPIAMMPSRRFAVGTPLSRIHCTAGRYSFIYAFVG